MISLPSCSNRALPALPALLLALLLVAWVVPGRCADRSAASPGPLIAVFPVENLSGAPAPLGELAAGLRTALEARGMRVVAPARVEAFIDEHHIRYVGGIDERTAATLREQTGAETVLISTLELYNGVFPPKFSMITRLVRLDGFLEIIWMESVGLSGDDYPGFLGLGLVREIETLRARGIEKLVDSLAAAARRPEFSQRLLPGRLHRREGSFTLMDLIRGIRRERPRLENFAGSATTTSRAETVEELLQKMRESGGLFMSRYAPRDWYSSQDTPLGDQRSIGIIPFFNRSTRKHAAELQALHLARELVSSGRFRLLELGVIRDKLLSMHVIMSDGVSIPSMDLIAISLGVDLLLNGRVFDYLDTVGSGSSPQVDFSLQMFAADGKRILWSSHSHNRGDDGVYFFDYGRVATAAALADRMNRALVLRMIENVR